MEVVRTVHNVRCDHHTGSTAGLNVVGVGDIDWVVGVAVGVVGDEPYWGFIGEDWDVGVGDVVVYGFVVDFFDVASSLLVAGLGDSREFSGGDGGEGDCVVGLGLPAWLALLLLVEGIVGQGCTEF